MWRSRCHTLLGCRASLRLGPECTAAQRDTTQLAPRASSSRPYFKHHPRLMVRPRSKSMQGPPFCCGGLGGSDGDVESREREQEVCCDVPLQDGVAGVLVSLLTLGSKQSSVRERLCNNQLHPDCSSRRPTCCLSVRVPNGPSRAFIPQSSLPASPRSHDGNQDTHALIHNSNSLF